MSRTWKIDPAHSTVGFAVRHMMITKVRGRFADFEGTITIDEDRPSDSSVAVDIDASSIDTGVGDRDDHLRSGDFLNAERFPEITFRSSRVEGWRPEEGSSFTVAGDLTIAGATRGVELEATFEGEGSDPWGGARVAFTASTTIDRRDFGLTWNQVLEAGGVLVGNDVSIELEVQAVESADADAAVAAGEAALTA